MSNPIKANNSLQPGDGLLIVDVQPDFCPGGKLAIPGGDQIIPVVNRWIAAAEKAGVPIYASRDWHPQGHMSFEEQGGDWPEHCVQDTPGAAFHQQVRWPAQLSKISKGVRLDKDQYSAFDDTGLAEHMRERDIRRVWVCGLAQDVCVHASVLDGCKQGFDVHLIGDATRPVQAESGDKALAEMQEAGATIHEKTAQSDA